jgi:hypothetical protein
MPGPEPDSVYRLIVDGFKSLGAADPNAVRRAVIFRERTFAGQRFLCGGMQAVRLAGEDVITFHDDRGSLLMAVSAGAVTYRPGIPARPLQCDAPHPLPRRAG